MYVPTNLGLLADMTDHLSTYGYWPSYNIPYFEFVYNISGYPSQYEQYGDIMSYSMCPRAQIFRRDQVYLFCCFKHASHR